MYIQNKNKILLLVFLIYILLNIFTIDTIVYAGTCTIDSAYMSSIVSKGESIFFKSANSNKYMYATLLDNDDVVFKDANELFDKIRKTKYELFKKGYDPKTPFTNTCWAEEKIVDNSGTLDGESIYKKSKPQFKDKSRESYSAKLTLKLYDGSQVTFVVPSSHYYGTVNGVGKSGYISKSEAKNDINLSDELKDRYSLDYILNTSAEDLLTEIEKAVKDGFIAGSVETGFNVGTIYSEKQQPLPTIMIERGKNEVDADENKSNKRGTGLFKFKPNMSLTATLDYFYSPLFGKMEVSSDFPKTAEDWSTNKYYSDILIDDDGRVKIDEGYINFVNPDSKMRVGLYDVDEGLDYTNGVQKYTKGNVIVTQTEEPQKLVDYTMRLAIPYHFVPLHANNAYALAGDGSALQLIEGVRMSLYNDTIYKDVEENNIERREKVCTNNDLDLERTHLVLFNQKVNGQPVGVVVVLKFNEAVVNTTPSHLGIDPNTLEENSTESSFEDKVYFTGRNVVFNNNYSESLVLDAENKDVLAVRVKQSNDIGIKARNFAFPSGSVATPEFLTSKDNHKIIEGSDGFTVLGTFIGLESIESSGSLPEDKKYGFVIFRNNTYVKDNQLLNWLTTKESKSLGFVKNNELRSLINGEFGAVELTFGEWYEMQRIQRELNYEKSTSLYRVINVLCILIGSMLIIFGMLFILAYWFDIFNTFSELSILYLISGRNMYPIASEDMTEFVSMEKSATKYVTFKGVLKVSIVCWFIGLFFLNVSKVYTFTISIYTYLMKMLG